MTIAVDPNVIPIGSKVLILFEEPYYKKYNGVYTARDVGGLVKGRKIDLFMGDFQNNKENLDVVKFGIRNAKIAVLNN